MFENRKIITIDTLQQHTSNIIKEVESYVIEKNLEVQSTIQTEIKSNDSALKDEISQRKLEDQKLQQSLEAYSKRVEDLDSNFKQSIQTEKTDRQAAIANEASTRESQLNSLQSQLQREITSTSQIINSTIDTTRSELSSEYKLGDQTLQSLLSQEISDRSSAIESLQSQLNSEIARREVGDKLTQETLETHLTSVQALPTQLTEHKENKNNPHGVTAEQIGAAKQVDLLNLSYKFDAFETTNLDTLKDQVHQIESDVENLEVNMISVNGSNQTLTGDLTIIKNNEASGDLVVEGDLIVKGSTKTVKQETLEVSDSLIVINSDGSDLLGINSGLAILTSPTTAYGITYNTTTDSVNLGSGQINSKGMFIPDANESYPILTRSNSSEFINGHVLIWDADNNRVIDGGALPNKIELSKEFVLLNDYNKDINTIQNNILVLNNKDIELTSLLNNLNISVNKKVDLTPTNIDGTYQLNTTKKNIIDAINENKNSIDGHITSTNNPHNVTLEQLNGEPKIITKNSAFNKNFSDSNPLMNGSAAAGTSTLVSRADHIHPTDTTRAPLDHSSETTTYGVGTTSKYGHVRVDASISSTSSNPVQNKVIKSYVDEELAKKLTITDTAQQIYATDTSGDPITYQWSFGAIGNTIVRRNGDGQFAVGVPTADTHVTTKKYVDDELNNLETSINNVISETAASITDNIQAIDDAQKAEIAALNQSDSNLQQMISEESNKRIAADDALATQLNQKINDTVSTMNAPLVSFLQDLLNQTPNTRCVASWKEVNGVATPYWIALDEGELN